jgi:hypothetical protein
MLRNGEILDLVAEKLTGLAPVSSALMPVRGLEEGWQSIPTGGDASIDNGASYTGIHVR